MQNKGAATKRVPPSGRKFTIFLYFRLADARHLSLGGFYSVATRGGTNRQFFLFHNRKNLRVDYAVLYFFLSLSLPSISPLTQHLKGI